VGIQSGGEDVFKDIFDGGYGCGHDRLSSPHDL
jgi:hypothetical protein